MVYRPTARVLTVLELLQSHGRMTGAELARRLEVDIRSVRNYVQTLLDLGIPVEAERGRYGAYRLRAGYKLSPLIFTEGESLALTLSLLVARQAGLATTAPAFEGGSGEGRARASGVNALPHPGGGTNGRIRAQHGQGCAFGSGGDGPQREHPERTTGASALSLIAGRGYRAGL